MRKPLRHRLATEGDIQSLCDMRWDHRIGGALRRGDLYDRFAASFAAFLRRALASGRWAVWVAEDDTGEIVSHIYLEAVEMVPKPEALDRSFVYMAAVYTKPEWRGKGVGGRLLQEACASVRGSHPESIIVWPSERAVSLYEREGFRRMSDAWVRED